MLTSMQNRIEAFTRARRERQVAKLDRKIALLTEYIRGLDETEHPGEVRLACEQRSRAWRKQRALLAKLPLEQGD